MSGQVSRGSAGEYKADEQELQTVACGVPLSMEFSRQEYSSGLPFPLPGDLPNPGIEPWPPVSPALHADSLPLSHQESQGYYTLVKL